MWSPQERAQKRLILLSMLAELVENAFNDGCLMVELTMAGLSSETAAKLMPDSAKQASRITPEGALHYHAKRENRMRDYVAGMIAQYGEGIKDEFVVPDPSDVLEYNYGALTDRILDYLESDAAKIEALLGSLGAGPANQR